MTPRTPFLKRQIPPAVISTIAIIASLCGLWFGFASLVGISIGCGGSALGMLLAVLGLLGQAAWWIDRYGVWSMIVPIIIIGLIILGVALIFVRQSNPVCF